MKSYTRILWAVVLFTAACSAGAAMTEGTEELALDFTRALCARDYDRAYEMTSSEYRQQVSLAGMREAFEAILPLEWGETEPVDVVTTLQNWRDKRELDRNWVYVSISGDVYGEGLAVVVTEEEGSLRIREVEWGRP